MNHSSKLRMPGIYLARVDRCDGDVDERGLSLDLLLLDARTGGFLCFDVLRFTPKATRIALTKLGQLGVPPGVKKIDTDALVGRRVWIALHEEEFDGVVRPKVDIRRLRCGFLNEAAGPPEACNCCGGHAWWRRRSSGLWICSGCCPQLAPAAEIDEVRP